MDRHFTEKIKSKVHSVYYDLKRLDVLYQFIKYAITGGTAFCVEYIVFYLLYSVWGLWYIWSNSLAMTIAFGVSFTLNRVWSFKSRENVYKQFVKYGILFLTNVLVSNIIMLVFTDIFGVKPLLSKLIAVGIIVCWNFIINKKIIFK